MNLDLKSARELLAAHGYRVFRDVERPTFVSGDLRVMSRSRSVVEAMAGRELPPDRLVWAWEAAAQPESIPPFGAGFATEVEATRDALAHLAGAGGEDYRLVLD